MQATPTDKAPRRRSMRGSASGFAAALARGATVLMCVAALAACAQQSRRPGVETTRPGAPSVGDTQPALDARPGYGVPVDPSGPVQMALLAPKSHPEAPVREIAQSMENAAQLAVQAFGDPRLRLRVYDTRGTAEGAAAAARRAAAEGAAVFIGPLFSTSVSAVVPVARQTGMTGIAFSSDAAVATNEMFLISYLAQQDIERVISYVGGTGVRSVGVMAPQTPLGDVAVAAAQTAAQRSGVRLGPITRYSRDFEGIESGAEIYAQAHLSPTGTPPQGVLIADTGDGLRTVAAFLAYYDVPADEVLYLGLSGWNNAITRGEPALHGGVFPAADPGVETAFGEAYAARFGAPPHPLAPLAHDAVAAAASLAADASEAGDPHPFRPELIANPSGFRGVTGVFRFRPDGLNERGLAVLEVGPEEFTVIDPAPRTFAGPS